MSADDLLAKVRDHAPTKRGRKKVFEPPERTDFRDGLTLNFDQTLSKTGWSLLNIQKGTLNVVECGVLECHPEGLTGFEETFAKDLGMQGLIEQVFQQVVPRAHWRPIDAIVHEMPSVKGYRLESALMAAAAVRRVARRFEVRPVVMISRQAAYATLVGTPSTEKALGTLTVNRLLHSHYGKRWTQDIHDSVLLGLKHLHKESR